MAAGALRRAKGFVRYAVSVQYHGGSFLGFTYQGPKGEDCIVSQRKKKSGRMGTVDLRGHRSVEGRLREALDDLFGGKDKNHRQWENIQVSSRTDRGVHALKNTFHVDIRTLPNNENQDDYAAAATAATTKQQQQDSDHDETTTAIERKLRDGLNFYLSRQSHGFSDNPKNGKQKQNPAMMNELRILNAFKSPEFMDNPYALTKEGRARNQTFRVDWNARFSATQRTYVYRLLCYFPRKQQQQQQHQEYNNSNNNDESSTTETATWQNDWNPGGYGYEIPFEWDRAWCLPQNHSHPLNVEAMKMAAESFVGTHDFSSFRGKLCVRDSPIVTMKSVSISSDLCHPIGSSGFLGIFDANTRQPPQQQQQQQQLVTITFVANSFLYRQVRNMVGCLVEVGKHGGRLSPGDVKDLLLVSSANNNNSSNWSHGNNKDGASSSEGDNGNNPSATTIKPATSSNQTKFKHRPYSTAPPQGLFLVDVQHGNFWF